MRVYAKQDDLAADAARLAQEHLVQCIAERGAASAILATGNSQIRFLDELIKLGGVDWSKLTLFHMDEYLGLDYSVALDLHLYFYTLRDILRWAIENRLTFYCSSPLNYDPKLHLGCNLAPLDLYVRHTQPLLNPIFRRVVRLLEPTRHDPVLPKFSNAAELYE